MVEGNLNYTFGYNQGLSHTKAVSLPACTQEKIAGVIHPGNS